jgi:hypothetical protein
MNPLFKAVRSLLRLIAAGLIIIGALMVGLEFLNHRAKDVEINFLKVAGYTLLLLAGVGLFAVSGKLAAQLTDEDDGADDSDDSQNSSE